MHCLFRLAFVLLLVGPSLTFAQPHFRFAEPVTPARAVQVVAQQGAFPAAPENSAAAVESCGKDYCEWAEIHVRLTKDGHHVAFRDETVDSTTDGHGRVADLTLDELKKLDAGASFAARFAGLRILTLQQMLDVAKGKVNLFLNCQQINPKSLVDDITAMGMENQVVVFADPTVLSQVKSASKDAIARIAKYRPSMPFDAFVKEVSPAVVQIDAAEVTSELCQKFHAVGMKVQTPVLQVVPSHPEIWGKVIDAGVDWVYSDDALNLRFFDARRRLGKFPVMIACHRGASRYAPENTIPAIREAAEIGADFAEIDIRTTKDGRTVLVHDGTVNRTTSAKGAVRDLLYDDVVALSAGAWFGKQFKEIRVPSFDEGLAVYGDKLGAYLDAKDVAPEILVAAIQKYHLSDRHVVYKSVEYCSKLHKLDPTVRCMPSLSSLDELDAIAAIKAYAVDAAWSVLSEESIAECHRRGIKVFSDALGANENVEQYRKAIGWGIDCIQTDHPLRVLRAIELVLADQPKR